MEYRSVGRLEINEVGNVIVNGVPTKDKVICLEVTENQKQHRCNYCHFIHNCRITHNLCHSSNRDDNKSVYFKLID